MKIIRNYLFNLSYQLFTIIIPIVTVPYISRSLGPDAIGVNAYTNSIMTYFILLANVGLSLYGNRTIAYFRNDEEQRSKKFWEIAILKIVMMLISIGAFFIFCSFYDKYRLLLLAQSVQLVAVGFDISWFFVGIEDFKKTVTRNILVKTVSLICIFTFVKSPDDLMLYILINGTATLLGNLTLWTYIKRYVKKTKIKLSDIKPHIIPVLSLFLPQLATNMFMTLNRLFLGTFSTLTQTGYFDNADKIVRIFLAFITALGTVVFPRIANYYKEGKQKEIEKFVEYAFNLVSLISIPIAIGVFIVSKPFSNLFFGSQFSGINIVLSILIFELIFMSWSSIIGQQFMVAINQIKGLTTSMIVSIILSSIGSVVIIPKYGANGAASMSVFAEFIIIAVQLYFVKNILNLKIIFQEIWKFFLSAFFMLVSCLIFMKLIANMTDIYQLLILSVIGVVTYIFGLLILKPKVLLEIKSLLKSKIGKSN